ncbi:MAG: hypothetical protein ACC707_20385 [Thiohalomonadales bacterium]
MFLAETVIAAIITYIIMLVAYFYHKNRKFHVPVMIGIIIFDLMMPIYLYATRDWKTRLIDEGDILSFGVWSHFGLIIALFVLYALQIFAGRAILASEDESSRAEHRSIAKGVLIVRGLVIITGAMLVQAEIAV